MMPNKILEPHGQRRRQTTVKSSERLPIWSVGADRGLPALTIAEEP